jgi:hypothetical protein
MLGEGHEGRVAATAAAAATTASSVHGTSELLGFSWMDAVVAVSYHL